MEEQEEYTVIFDTGKPYKETYNTKKALKKALYKPRNWKNNKATKNT